MDKKTFWIIAGATLAILVVLVVWQTMQINALAVGSSAAQVATTTVAPAAQASSGMVGGC